VDAYGVADQAPDEDWERSQHPRGPKLTTEMIARLQGWHGPEYGWQFEGRKTSRHRQIGNAFPPPVARAVGESIARALRKEGAPEQVRPERKMHDEVYRVLRDRGEWLTVNRIQKLLGGHLTAEDIAGRIQLLMNDFVVEIRARGQHTSFKLGDWRAFRGQANHERHLAFTELRNASNASAVSELGRVARGVSLD
jgi:DNA (cytosine-5)-methyltransferase 1